MQLILLTNSISCIIRYSRNAGYIIRQLLLLYFNYNLLILDTKLKAIYLKKKEK